MRPILALLLLTACHHEVVVHAPPAPKLPPLSLLAPTAEVSCVRTAPNAVIEGAHVDTLTGWPADCLPVTRPLSDLELLRAAEVELEAGPQRRVLSTFSRGVWLDTAGYGRRAANWAARISFTFEGVEGVALIDAVTGRRLSDAWGRPTSATANWFEVTPSQWNAATATAPTPADGVPTRYVTLRDGQAMLFDKGPALSSLVSACSEAHALGCVERLERTFPHPRAVLLQRGDRVSWVVDGHGLLTALGGALTTASDAELFVLVTGLDVPPLPEGVHRWEERFPIPGYFRFDDPKHPSSPGVCGGFVLEADGTTTKICPPKQPCHAPTKEQLAVLGPTPPKQVCETGDGGFSWVMGEGDCKCSTGWRKGLSLGTNCMPCIEHAPNRP